MAHAQVVKGRVVSLIFVSRVHERVVSYLLDKRSH